MPAREEHASTRDGDEPAGEVETGDVETGELEAGQVEDGPLEEGTVKWYSRARGYGFILRADGSEVFVHHSALVDRRYRVLDDGERVRFRVTDGERGAKAVAVERLGRGDAP